MDGMILKRGGDPSKLKMITETYTATEGQTVFSIAYETFDYLSDNVFVISGRTILTPDLDYTLVAGSVTLVEGVPEGRTITISILKNVNTDAEDETMSGAYIEDASIPLDKLAEDVLTEAELPAAVQSLLVGGEVSVVKSIQHGSVSIAKGTQTATVTISAVNTAKAYIHLTIGASNNYGGDGVTAAFNSDTEILFDKNRSINDNGYLIKYSVIEYY